MTDISDLREMKPRITVFGVGGAGGNAVNNMITAGLQGVDFVVANTDAQALAMSKAARIIQMGVQVTEGLGAGSRPEVGRAAAEEVIEEIRDHLSGAHMVFVTAGMGGGTGTGAATVIAKAAQELGILTIGVVTKPFHFEGQRRMRLAEAGIVDLQKVADTLLIIPNQNLFRVANEKTTFADAFAMADRVLYSGVACITDLIVKEGLINLDFADVRAVMREKGKAMMGMGEASGANRVLTAAETAISNPLIEDPSIKRASGLLISITGGNDLTLFEVDEAATRIREEADQDANIIIGATFDDSLEGIVRVSVVATGIDNTGVARQLQQHEGAPATLAERLRHDGRRIAERTQQEASFRPMPITPSLLGLAQAEPSIASAVSMTPAADHMSRTPRMPRIDELPPPRQNEIRAAQRKERDDSRPEKRHTTLMQRLASIGLGRRAEEDEPSGANAASRTLEPRNTSVHSSVSTTREYPHSFPHNLIDEDALDSPAFLREARN
jgi:cell division protein FtsZ